MSKLDTKDWKLTAELDYKLVSKPTNITCTGCGGSGEVGGGFKSLDGPTTCTTCWGSGGWLDYSNIEPKPEVPQGLVEHMRNAYQEYLEKM